MLRRLNVYIFCFAILFSQISANGGGNIPFAFMPILANSGTELVLSCVSGTGYVATWANNACTWEFGHISASGFSSNRLGGNFSWTVPATGTYEIIVVGGGGGGSQFGGGGGSGYAAKSNLSLTASSVKNIVIGDGGVATGGASFGCAGVAGSSGSQSSFDNTTLTAGGGSGGAEGLASGGNAGGRGRGPCVYQGGSAGATGYFSTFDSSITHGAGGTADSFWDYEVGGQGGGGGGFGTAKLSGDTISTYAYPGYGGYGYGAGGAGAAAIGNYGTGARGYVRIQSSSTASVAPTGLALTHSTRNRGFTVSWTAGSGNNGAGGCKLQYYQNGTTWTDLAGTYNCDSTTTNAAANLPSGDNWTNNFNGTGVQVRILRISDSTAMGTFTQRTTCTPTSGSASSTPTIDEDCNALWNDIQTTTTGNGEARSNGTFYPGQSFTCPSTHYWTGETLTGSISTVYGFEPFNLPWEYRSLFNDSACTSMYSLGGWHHQLYMQGPLPTTFNLSTTMYGWGYPLNTPGCYATGHGYYVKIPSGFSWNLIACHYSGTSTDLYF